MTAGARGKAVVVAPSTIGGGLVVPVVVFFSGLVPKNGSIGSAVVVNVLMESAGCSVIVGGPGSDFGWLILSIISTVCKV